MEIHTQVHMTEKCVCEAMILYTKRMPGEASTRRKPGRPTPFTLIYGLLGGSRGRTTQSKTLIKIKGLK